MLRAILMSGAFLALAGCSPGGFEVVKEADGDALAIFPDGGFHDPEAACVEYVTSLNEKEARAGAESSAALRAVEEGAGVQRGGFYCRAR